MTRRVYRSTDFGASALSGEAGKLITILDAVLVNGYGQQTASSVVGSSTGVGITVTVTLPVAHGWVKTAKVTIAGASDAAYNGEFSATPTTPTAFTYVTTGSAATTSPTGTITAKLAGAGWTKEYSTGGTLAAYKQGSGSNGFYMRIDDSVAASARIVGYEAMSGISAGTGDFPTAAQVSGGLYILKSTTADATARPWMITASEKSIRIFIDNNSANTSSNLTFFGDLTNYGTDAYATMIIGNTAANSSSASHWLGASLTTAASPANTHFIARTYLGTGTSITASKHSDQVKGAATIGAGNMSYPAPVDGALYMAPIFVSETVTGALRGEIPGLWNPLHNKPFAHLDVFDGSGTFAGKKFQAHNHVSSTQFIIEISDT